ncbi:hypothetical protein ACGFX4_38510 [Kitasatospora sp. NPDC048365]|uniref:hypothetical protein n=1 Tax=Kitasatospora sp. NPDC048365 TaxID=3364050 RepID=UPI00371F4816
MIDPSYSSSNPGSGNRVISQFRALPRGTRIALTVAAAALLVMLSVIAFQLAPRPGASAASSPFDSMAPNERKIRVTITDKLNISGRHLLSFSTANEPRNQMPLAEEAAEQDVLGYAPIKIGNSYDILVSPTMSGGWVIRYYTPAS